MELEARFFDGESARLAPVLVEGLVRHEYTHHLRELERGGLRNVIRAAERLGLPNRFALYRLMKKARARRLTVGA